MVKHYNRIREVVKSKGIKQTWLAERLGMTWLLNTNLGNQHKKQMLDKISDYLHLGLKVIVKE